MPPSSRKIFFFNRKNAGRAIFGEKEESGPAEGDGSGEGRRQSPNQCCGYPETPNSRGVGEKDGMMGKKEAGAAAYRHGTRPREGAASTADPDVAANRAAVNRVEGLQA